MACSGTRWLDNQIHEYNENDGTQMNILETAKPQNGPPRTIYQCFHRSATSHPGKVALLYKNEQNKYIGMSYGQLRDRVCRVAGALGRLGIAKGDRVALLSRNRPEWAISDLAILKLGAIVVPIYQTLPPNAVAHMINDSGSKLVFVENGRLLALVEAIRESIPGLEKVVVFGPAGGDVQGVVLPFSQLYEESDRPIEADPGDQVSAVQGDDLATIVYTSGTTGEPKGAVLTHNNIVSNAMSALSRFRFSPEDAILSYLPLCHMFERTCGYYTFLFSGARIAYAQDMSTIIEDIQQIKPTILIAVPRIIEKVYEAVKNKIQQSSSLRRKLVMDAIGSLNECVNLTYQGRRIPVMLHIKRRFYDALIASKFRKIAGGKLRLLVSGGAPLDMDIEKTLFVLGFNILQGYGLTETSPVVTCRSVEDNQLGTVGKPLDGVEVRIGPDQEILVRGPNVMQGYYNRPEETKAAIDEEGWFHTGDQGRFDPGGNMIITGRIKELIITSYGKNVAPVPVEKRLGQSIYIEQSVLIGDQRKYVTALIVPRREILEGYAREQNIITVTYQELLKKEPVRNLFAEEIEKANADLPGFEQVKEFILLAEPFSVDNGLLTPTLKVRRRKILEKYSRQIDAMYGASMDGQ
jgi:long-chain acyl-CoA synthetase